MRFFIWVLLCMLFACAGKEYTATQFRTDGSVESQVQFSTTTFIYGPTLQDVTATDGNRTISIGSEKSDAAKAIGLAETVFKAYAARYQLPAAAVTGVLP